MNERLQPLPRLTPLRGPSPRWGGGLERYLDRNEHIEAMLRQHVVVLASPIAVAFAGLVLAGMLAIHGVYWLALIVVVGFLGYLVRPGLDWWFHQYALTNRQLLTSVGIIARDVKALGYSQVTDSRLEVPILGRVLNYGHLVLDTAGQDPGLPVMRYIPRPIEVMALVGQITHSSSDTSRVETTIASPWQTIRDRIPNLRGGEHHA